MDVARAIGKIFLLSTTVCSPMVTGHGGSGERHWNEVPCLGRSGISPSRARSELSNRVRSRSAEPVLPIWRERSNHLALDARDLAVLRGDRYAARAVAIGAAAVNTAPRSVQSRRVVPSPSCDSLKPHQPTPRVGARPKASSVPVARPAAAAGLRAQTPMNWIPIGSPVSGSTHSGTDMAGVPATLAGGVKGVWRKTRAVQSRPLMRSAPSL